jgi:lauroyl/myristoyl acyltransferase
MAAASRIAAGVDPRVIEPLAVLGGTLEWAFRPAKRRVLAVNLAHAVGRPAGSRTVRRLVRRELQNEARRSADLLWAIGRPGEFGDRTRVTGAGRAAAIARAGRGIVLVGAHVGGWELAAPLATALFERPATVVVTDDWLAWAADGIRRTAGLRVVYDTGPLVDVVHGLRRGEVFVVLFDIAAAGRVHRVHLLGCDVDLPAGAVVLARLGRAPLVPFAVLREAPRQWRVDIGRPIEPAVDRAGDVRALQRLADAWSPILSALPDQWAAVEPLHWHCEPDVSEPRRSARGTSGRD